MMSRALWVLLFAMASADCHAQQEAWSEFMAAQRATYSTTGAAKAKGLEVSFDYPISWSGADGRRPNTLYQVTSERGKGLELCNLLIRELPLPADYTPTRPEIAELFEKEALFDFIPADANFIDGAPTQLDGQLGAWIRFSQDMNRAGMSIQMQSVAFPIYFDKKLVFFSCSVGAGGDTPRQAVLDRFNGFFPLFQQMANSLIVHSRWKSAP